MCTFKMLIFTLLLPFLLSSCSLFIQTDFYEVDTKRFESMEQKAKFKKEDAWKIYTAYCKQKQIHQDTARTRFLYGRFNNNYVFKNRLLDRGKMVYFYDVVYVNTKTGKARYVRKTWRTTLYGHYRVWQGDGMGTFIEIRDLK